MKENEELNKLKSKKIEKLEDKIKAFFKESKSKYDTMEHDLKAKIHQEKEVVKKVRFNNKKLMEKLAE